MRVLNVIDGSGWSGGVEQTLLLARGMRERGVEAEIACNRANTILLREAGAAGVPITAFEEKGRHNPENYRRLRAIAARGFDVLIGHKPKSVVYSLTVRPLLPRTPRVIAVRRVSRPISRLSSWTKYRFPDRVVAVSQSVAELLARGGVPPEKIVCIPSGVDLRRFRARPESRDRVRSALGIPERAIAIVHVANFTDRKGHRFLMEALGRIGAGLGPVRLVLAGRATDDAECRALARHHGLEEKTIHLGMRRDVEEILAACDLFVFPSLPGIDAIAGAVLQAMCVDLPVIASAIGGIPEYVEDGMTGWLVPPGDVPALAERIRGVMAMTPAARGGVAARGGERVRAEYGIDRTVERYLALCEELTPVG